MSLQKPKSVHAASQLQCPAGGREVQVAYLVVVLTSEVRRKKDDSRIGKTNAVLPEI